MVRMICVTNCANLLRLFVTCISILCCQLARQIKFGVLDTVVVNTHTVTMRSPTSLRAHCVAVVAWLAAAGIRSRAQFLFEAIPQAECSVSDLVGYDFVAEPLGSGLSLHWSISPFDTVSFQVVSADPEVGWLSIGFSADGNMIGSDAVVGAEGLVLEYNLGSKALPVQSSPTIEESISLFAIQEITNSALERVGDSTSMSFTRPSTPESLGKQPLFPATGDPVTLLWAAGPDDAFGYHFLGRGAFTVDLLCTSNQLDVDVEQPFPTGASTVVPLTEAPSMTPPEVLAFTVSPTSAPTSPFPPRSLDDGTTSGAPGLLEVGGSLFGLPGDFARALAFGVIAIGVSATSILF